MGAILASQPSTLGRVLDQGFRLFRLGLRVLLPFTLTLFGCGLILQFVQRSLVAKVTGRGLDSSAWGAGLAIALAMLALIAVEIIVIAASLHRLAAAESAAGSTGESWAAGRRVAPRLIGASLLLVLYIFAIVIVPGVASIFLLRDGAVGKGVAAVILVVLFTLIVYLAVRWMLLTPEVVLNDAGPRAAIRGSWRLTRGHFWRITGFYAVILVIFIALYAGFGALAGAGLAALVALTSLPRTSIQPAVAVVSAALVIVSVPLSTGMLLALWNDLKMRAEGSDLGAKIDALKTGR